QRGMSMRATDIPLCCSSSTGAWPLRPTPRRSAALATVVLATLSLGAAAADLSQPTVAAIDSAIQSILDKDKVPGLSVAVVANGQLSLARGYGLADIENNVPATDRTVYRLASISKMLTATAVMQLVEQGKLDLSAPIQKYVPEFPEKPWPITAE